MSILLVTHAFPLAMRQKANDDGIPLFGWKEDGWLTMSEYYLVLHDDTVNWFVTMKKKGSRLSKSGSTASSAESSSRNEEGRLFKMIDQPQYFYKKSEGFRHR